MTSSQANIVRRLIVELNQRSDDDLTRAAEAEQITKTTVVNRAIQVYEMVRANQAAGGHIIRVNPDGTSEKVTFT